jgi:hypothetical protein
VTCAIDNIGSMATNIRISGVPEDLLREARMLALATGRTLRELVMGAIEREVSGEIEVQEERSKPSPKAQRGVSRQRSVKRADRNESLPRVETSSAPREKIMRCSHGLLLHPGCTD